MRRARDPSPNVVELRRERKRVRRAFAAAPAGTDFMALLFGELRTEVAYKLSVPDFVALLSTRKETTQPGFLADFWRTLAHIEYTSPFTRPRVGGTRPYQMIRNFDQLWAEYAANKRENYFNVLQDLRADDIDSMREILHGWGFSQLATTLIDIGITSLTLLKRKFYTDEVKHILDGLKPVPAEILENFVSGLPAITATPDDQEAEAEINRILLESKAAYWQAVYGVASAVVRVVLTLVAVSLAIRPIYSPEFYQEHTHLDAVQVKHIVTRAGLGEMLDFFSPDLVVSPTDRILEHDEALFDFREDDSPQYDKPGEHKTLPINGIVPADTPAERPLWLTNHRQYNLHVNGWLVIGNAQRRHLAQRGVLDCTPAGISFGAFGTQIPLGTGDPFLTRQKRLLLDVLPPTIPHPILDEVVDVVVNGWRWPQTAHVPWKSSVMLDWDNGALSGITMNESELSVPVAHGLPHINLSSWNKPVRGDLGFGLIPLVLRMRDATARRIDHVACLRAYPMDSEPDRFHLGFTTTAAPGATVIRVMDACAYTCTVYNKMPASVRIHTAFFARAIDFDALLQWIYHLEREQGDREYIAPFYHQGFLSLMHVLGTNGNVMVSLSALRHSPLAAVRPAYRELVSQLWATYFDLGIVLTEVEKHRNVQTSPFARLVDLAVTPDYDAFMRQMWIHNPGRDDPRRDLVRNMVDDIIHFNLVPDDPDNPDKFKRVHFMTPTTDT